MIRPSRRSFAAVATVGVLSVSVLCAGVAHAWSGSSGDVAVSGSSTVEPISSLVAELFAEKNPDVSVRVDGPGTGDGFKLFCNDQTDISDASRPIKPEEATACQDKGVEYTELPIGIDGLTIVANKSSKLKCVDFGQIYGLFGPESDGTYATAQSIASEVGSTNTALPASGSVKKFTPGPESGTYDSFIEIAEQKAIDARIAAGKVKTTTDDKGKTVASEPLVSDGQFPNDNDIVKRVEGTKNGVGFFGFAYYDENAGDLKAIAVQNPETGKCVKPTRTTIQNESYPVRRTLFVYPNNKKVADNKSVKDFLGFYLTKKNLTKSVAEAGYIALTPAQISETIQAWKSLAG